MGSRSAACEPKTTSATPPSATRLMATMRPLASPEAPDAEQQQHDWLQGADHGCVGNGRRFERHEEQRNLEADGDGGRSALS